MLGKIVSIKDNVIYVKLAINIYNIANLVNKNVTFADGHIGEIVNISNSYAEVLLIGKITDKSFIPGNLSFPSFGCVCNLSSKNDIDLIYGVNKDINSIRIGKSLIYDEYPVCLDIDNFFSNHFAILGNTGSGKSCFTAKLFQSIFSSGRNIPSKASIFLFDAYGEYQEAFSNINNLNYRVFTTDLSDGSREKLFIPFWLLSTDDICLLLGVDDLKQISIIEKALKLVWYFCRSDEEVINQKNDILARALLDVIFSGVTHSEARNKIITILSKFNTQNINLEVRLTKGGWTRTVRQCIAIDETGRFADIEVIVSYLEKFCVSDFELSLPNGSYMYSIRDYYNALEFALISEGIFSSNKVFDYANILKIRLNSLINSDYVNYFNCSNYISRDDYIKYLLYKNVENKYQIINFNINYVDDRFAKVLVKIYSRILFSYITMLPDRASMPFHIVLEEAHRYIQDDIDVKVLGYNIFDRIAKEGRKYGILLGIISQRPSEISQTTISQCANFAVFKMFYGPDIEFVVSSVPGVSNSAINRIKTFPAGSCILFGTALKMPILASIDIPNPLPSGSSAEISKTWY